MASSFNGQAKSGTMRSDYSAPSRRMIRYDGDMRKIQVLGAGCARCEKLAENAERAVREAGIEGAVEKVADIDEILAFGVMMTPALVIDGEVKVVGQAPGPEQIRKLL